MEQIEEPLRAIIGTFYQVEIYSRQRIAKAIVTGRGFPYDLAVFRAQLRTAIDENLKSPEEYEALTGENFDSQEDLNAWLEEMYSEVPVLGACLRD